MARAHYADPRLPESFWIKVRPDGASGCWNWTAARDRNGYGRAGSGRRSGTRLSHRHAYMVLVAEIDSGLVLDHLCRNPSCCNPAHLEPVTQGENLRRAPMLGVSKNSPPHCPRGHAFTDENTLYKKRNDRFGVEKRHRICRTCNRQWCANYDAKRKAKQR
jgi:hypothetical protein